MSRKPVPKRNKPGAHATPDSEPLSGGSILPCNAVGERRNDNFQPGVAEYHIMCRFVLGLVAPALLFVLAGCVGSGTSPSARARTAPQVDEGFVDAGAGVRLFYRAVGVGGDTVIVLNGGPGLSLEYIAADLEPLAARHVLLVYDQRGGGRSTLVADSASLDAQRFADDLEALRLHFGLRRLTLLAHSWGGTVAALYAARHPQRVERLIIVNSIPARHAHLPEMIRRLDARRDPATQRRLQELHTAFVADPADREACRAYHRLWFVATWADTAAVHRSRADFCAVSPESQANRIANVERFTLRSQGDWDWRPALGTVAAPALVIHGTADFVPPESAREWAAALPNGRLLLLERSGHFPYLEEPERFFPAVEAFLAGGWPPGAERVQ